MPSIFFAVDSIAMSKSRDIMHGMGKRRLPSCLINLNFAVKDKRKETRSQEMNKKSVCLRLSSNL